MSITIYSFVCLIYNNKIYLTILEISAEKSLNLNFYEDCIDRDLGVCTPKTKGNENYLRYFSQSEKPECQNYEQVAQSMNDVLQFCVDMEGSSWYGGAEVTFQHWPLNNLNWTNNPYVTKSSGDQAVSINRWTFKGWRFVTEFLLNTIAYSHTLS